MKTTLALCAALVLAGGIPAAVDYGAKVGGTTAPDGTPIQIDLPDSEQQKNIASKGLGCCVFRSIDHAARWANEPSLIHFPEWMVSKGIAGGGYPGKVTDLVPKIAKDRGMPAPPFIQVEGKDLKILELAAANGIMPCVTYSRSPTGRYGGQSIAHMTNLSHCDSKWVAVLDNNYICTKEHPDMYEWMTPEEFSKAYSGTGGGWAVLILKPAPPPPPHN